MQHSAISDEANIEKIILSLSVSRITFLSFEEKKNLEKNLDSPAQLALMSIDDISKITGRQIKSTNWNGNENLRISKRVLQYCNTQGIDILHNTDFDYPELLRQIADPPFLLFCRGNKKILAEKSISVVGTRRLTPSGKKAAFSFAHDAVLNGCNVISGLASGADSFAHKGAVSAIFDRIEAGQDLEEIGKTVAVLPSAIDNIVPSSNKVLASNILKTGGCIISEYEPGLALARWHFVARNRIIAGLSPAIVVIEAPPGSGALITADFALEYNRDLMFHEAAVCEDAIKLSQDVKSQLEKDFAVGKVSKYKVENSLKKFLDAGAPIIKDYKDYCQCLVEEPGSRSNQSIQTMLFD